MKMIIIGLLFTIDLVGNMPEQQQEFQSNCKPESFVGWYRVTESTRPDIWGIQMFSIRQIQGAKDNALLLTGFSNQGISVEAKPRRCKLKIAKQVRKVIPFGGRGEIEWEVQVQAEGKLRDTILVLNYELLFPETGERIKSSILAEKIPDDKI